MTELAPDQGTADFLGQAGWGIGVGVVAGILTAAVLWLGARFFWNMVVPFYQGLKYSGRNVAGSWVVAAPILSQDCSLSLKQHAQAITGTAAFRLREGAPQGTDPFRLHRVDGDIADGVVMLAYQSDDPHRFGRGSFLLQVHGDGRYMTGWLSFYGATGSLDPLATPCFAVRAETEVDKGIYESWQERARRSCGWLPHVVESHRPPRQIVPRPLPAPPETFTEGTGGGEPDDAEGE